MRTMFPPVSSPKLSVAFGCSVASNVPAKAANPHTPMEEQAIALKYKTVFKTPDEGELNQLEILKTIHEQASRFHRSPKNLLKSILSPATVTLGLAAGILLKLVGGRIPTSFDNALPNGRIAPEERLCNAMFCKADRRFNKRHGLDAKGKPDLNAITPALEELQAQGYTQSRCLKLSLKKGTRMGWRLTPLGRDVLAAARNIH